MNRPSQADDANHRGRDKAHRRLLAAYCDGMRLVAVVVITAPGGWRVAAAQPGQEVQLGEGEAVTARWWCRRAAEAASVAAAAATKLGVGSAAPHPTADLPAGGTTGRCPVTSVKDAILGAARRLHVPLLADGEVREAAMDVATRVEQEMYRLQRAGELKSVNAAYRAYRIEASGRGEKVLRYSDWMANYRENLVRKLAATLRAI
jgi:hypothetical protein